MSPEPDPSQPPPGNRGVFGNLPSERPGVRSPRRDTGEPKGDPKRAKSEGGPANAPPKPQTPPRRPAPERTPPPSRPSSGQRPEAASPDPDPAGRRSVEEVAWTGVTVAAEAATLGVRLLSRALEAVRERR